MLEVKNLTKKFGKKTVLNDFSFSFENKTYGLLAPNGEGKTTLFRCIAQLYPEGKKCVYYDGKLVSKNREILNRFGYLPQQFGIFKELNVFDALNLFANIKGMSKQKAEEEIKKNLETVNLSDSINTKVSKLSGGMLRRVGIAAALLNDPCVLMLDEPSAGLDPEERIRLKYSLSFICRERTTIISTHIVEDVESICDELIIIKNGTVYAHGSCEEIADFANGKTYMLPESEVGSILGEYHITKRFETDGKIFIRVVCREKQDFESVAPDVNEGYICIIKDLK